MTPYARVASPRGKAAHLAPSDTLIPLCPAGNLTGPLLETADGTLPLCKKCEKITDRPGPQQPPRIPYADKAVARAAMRAASQPPAPESGAGEAEAGHDSYPDPAGVVPGPAATQTPAGGEPAAAARPSSSPDRIHVPPVAAARPRFARPWWLRLGRKGGGE